MPYKSPEQAAYMHIHHPEIAKRWDAKYYKRSEAITRRLKKHGT